MARPVSITRDPVLDAAFTLVRREGVNALTARALGCSTQPLYPEFASMEALGAAAVERATAQALRLFRESGATDLDSGLGVLRLIAEEPHLFALLTRDRAAVEARVRRGPLRAERLDPVRSRPALEGLGEAQLRRVHTKMWFFAQGAAVLLERDASPAAQHLARAYGSLAGAAIIAWARTTPELPR